MALKHILAVLAGMGLYYMGVVLMKDVEESDISFEELPEEVRAWRNMGRTTHVNDREMFYIYQKCTDPKNKSPPTFAILHGFPSSSYEYHKVLEKLAKYGNVVLNDHVGFGFSEGPRKDYKYSLGEAAENVLALWRQLGIKKAHVVSHDMGDSVLTEILARRYRKMLPNYFDEFFQSVTFTNGGMNFNLINFRIVQHIGMYPKIAVPLTNFARMLGIQEWAFKNQVGSIWSPGADPVERDRDIDHLYLINCYNNEITNGHNTIYYLWDRFHFEFRWYAALKKLDIPSRFIWADSDAVSPITIPKFFEKMVPNFDLTLVKNRGHFFMLEDPDVWVKEVVKILKK